MKLFFFVIIIFCSSQTVFTQEIKLMNKFESYSHTLGTTTIPYRMFIPENLKENKLPLVVALHGAGERGSDNSKQIMYHRLATVWVDSVNQKEHPCFVIAPQCPEENKWVDINWGCEKYDYTKTPISNELATVVDLIDSIVAKYPVDKTRIYITGLSMGGFGAWYLLINNPNRFAAAIVMSSSADPQMACNIANIPLWVFHGDIDNAVPVEGSRKMVKAISDCAKDFLLISDPNDKSFFNSIEKQKKIINSEHLYTEYKNKGHAVWKESYDNWFVREWMFSKRLK